MVVSTPIRFETNLPPKRRRLGWRLIAELVAEQFTQGITTEKIALSLAVGSFCAFFPILGAATPLCVVAAAGLRLNQPIVQLVNWGTAPLYLPLVYGFIRLGDLLLGSSRGQLDAAVFFHHFGALVGHALLGWAVLGPFWLGIGYFSALPALRAVAAARGLAKA
jgi:uncharacterized protein (DUF2062 family)